MKDRPANSSISKIREDLAQFERRTLRFPSVRVAAGILGKVSDYVTIVPVVGKGLGAIAARDVDPGVTLLSEEPLLVIPKDGDCANEDLGIRLLRSGDQLDPINKTRYLLLSDKGRRHSSRLMRVYSTNSFCWPTSDGKQAGIVFYHTSRINHSCVPNSGFLQTSCFSKVRIISRQPIKKGDEITINYNHADLAGMIAVERKSWSKRTYGFECDCAACSKPTVSSDRRRRIIRKAMEDKTREHVRQASEDPKMESTLDASAATPHETQKTGLKPGETQRGVARRVLKAQVEEGLVCPLGIVWHSLKELGEFFMAIPNGEVEIIEEPLLWSSLQQVTHLMRSNIIIWKQLCNDGNPDSNEGIPRVEGMLQACSDMGLSLVEEPLDLKEAMSYTQQIVERWPEALDEQSWRTWDTLRDMRCIGVTATREELADPSFRAKAMQLRKTLKL